MRKIISVWNGVRVLLALLLLCGAAPSVRADRVDDYLKAEMAKRHIPGLSVAVVRDGKVVLAKGYGLADVELSVPATADTVYEIGSVTKQFTATAVMMLVEEGKLGLDDRVAKHLPGLPSAWGEVTVRQLLNHTSGIKSYTSLPNVQKLWRNDYAPEEILKLVSEAPLEFTPGEKWAYNNTGYFLLGMIIEKVGGKPYGEFVAERIFKPLGMTATRVNDWREIIPNRASGYTWDGKTLRNAEYASMTWPYSAGVLVSTVTDMAKWDAALYSDRLLKRSSLDQMWTPTKLAGGQTQDYGFGWGVDTFRGHKRISHGGGIPGFTSQIARFVDDKLTVVVLTNADSANPGALASGVAAVYLPDLAPENEKSVEDKDPEVTELLRRVLTSTREGKADPALFTPEARAEIFPDRVKQAEAAFKALGPLKSLTLRERATEGKSRRFLYRAAFGDTALLCQIVLAEDGKIAGLMLRPE